MAYIGLHSACRYGHKELTNLLFDKGANDLYTVLSTTCREGHKILVNFIISKGATGCSCGKSMLEHQ